MTNSNLIVLNTGYKDLLLKKLSCSVICSVLMQLLVYFLCVLIINFSLFHPIEWLLSVFGMLTSINIWLFLIPFASIIFAQGLICAKDYVLKQSYCTTRFQKIFYMLSLRNFTILILHIVSGGIGVWLYLLLIDGSYVNLYSPCLRLESCLNEGTFYMLFGGFWNGFYYFTFIYTSHKQLIYPVVNQHKFIQFKANIISILKNSKTTAIWCVLYYVIFYYFWGSEFRIAFSNITHSYTHQSKSDVWIYLYMYIFTVLYFFEMNLMHFFFDLFLTEPVQFPLIAVDNNTFTIQDAIKLNTLPIVQNLACQDLYLMSKWSMQRRQILFTLSQPGGHPHNWNALVESVLKLFKEYSELLNKATDKILNPNILKKETPQVVPANLYTTHKYENIRNMSLIINEPTKIIDVTYHKPANVISTMMESFNKKSAEMFHKLTEIIKQKSGYNYLFNPIPEVDIYKCLSQGQIIIWTCEGISALVVASIKEDPYGIVQKDLPVIINSLVELKCSIDKLNKVPGLSRRGAGFNEFYFKMKLAVSAALRRTLVNICLNFRDFLPDLPLSREVMQQLQNYVVSTS